ncbi:DUF4190 domain-containing protein [Glycomyces sp. TRM65418]|uniref:DUF4190 domain-containing protein n=1 Tax=Glycomyces sp. TRM65418 TaxID=2867006 RepID=UPI001CE53121|nr:DUF4190 domain-containing protein [Glycomyces sp. TRM65418]MCC3761906.1 DUF4190 domain-containing protein [Glycomyces sp. TRM65418]QZD55987.1 DUF4190 domain-containing protein [Glycomyces sp. TRM65418]
MSTPDPNPYQPYQAPPPYVPYPPYGYAPYRFPPPRPTNGMAIAAMVCGIVGVCSIVGVLGIIFGMVAKRQIRESGDGGDGMATAGIVLGWIGVAATLFWIAYYVFAVAMIGAAVNEIEDWPTSYPPDDPSWIIGLAAGF